MRFQLLFITFVLVLFAGCGSGGGYVATVTAESIARQTREAESNLAQTEVFSQIDLSQEIEALCASAEAMPLVESKGRGLLWVIHLDANEGGHPFNMGLIEAYGPPWKQDGSEYAQFLYQAETVACLKHEVKGIMECNYFKALTNEPVAEWFRQISTYIALIDVPTRTKIQEFFDPGGLPPTECPKSVQVPLSIEESNYFFGAHTTIVEARDWIFANWEP